MWVSLWKQVDEMFKMLGGLDRQQWMIVLITVLILGFFCLRGFGSRSNY